jgi:hypothetical protein
LTPPGSGRAANAMQEYKRRLGGITGRLVSKAAITGFCWRHHAR